MIHTSNFENKDMHTKCVFEGKHNIKKYGKFEHTHNFRLCSSSYHISRIDCKKPNFIGGEAP